MTKRRALFIVLCVFSSVAAAADSDADALRALGAEVTVSNGVVTSARLNCGAFRDAEYQRLAKVKTLTSLTIGGAPRTLTDERLKLLGPLTELEFIQIDGAELSDDGYRHFTAFQKLKRLSLFHPSRDRKDFTGAGLAHLKELPRFERLTFAGATAGDTAFQAVSQIKQLRDFSEWHNWETVAGIEHLTRLPNLKVLKIGQRLPSRGRPDAPSLDDATLAVIAQMRSLEKIELQEARLTLAGLRHLKSLPSLTELKVQWVETPAGDIEQLRQLLPSVKLNWLPITEHEVTDLLQKKLKL